MLLAFATMAFGFTSCGDGDEEGGLGLALYSIGFKVNVTSGDASTIAPLVENAANALILGKLDKLKIPVTYSIANTVFETIANALGGGLQTLVDKYPGVQLTMELRNDSQAGKVVNSKTWTSKS